MPASAFLCNHASKWCHNSHTAFTVKRTEFPNKSLWVTFAVIYLWFEKIKKFSYHPHLVFPQNQIGKVSHGECTEFPSQAFPLVAELLINRSDNEDRNFSISTFTSTAARSRRKARTSAAFPPCHRQTQHKGLRAETSGIILWESDMKFYYKNPLRCMMITWKALMRKIHLLWRIATGGSKWRKAENANQHTLTADSKFQFYAIKSEVGRERAMGEHEILHSH